MIIKELFLEINKLVGADFDVLECRINKKKDEPINILSCFLLIHYLYYSIS